VNRSVWVIIILGFLTVVILVIAMLGALRTFGDSPQSNATKLALAVKAEFKFESVGTAVRDEGMKGALFVQYETHADSKFNQEAQLREMEKVALFASSKLDIGERKRVDEIRVRRTEIHGRGCFKQSYVSNHVQPNPNRGGMLPPSPFRPP